ncbi:MAG: hypothetical protein HUU35_07595 [Armatimonadetes bacterium]|nr:hypothetical protein [Armatimonadota bacterium]
MRLKLTEKWPAVTDTFVAADESGQPLYTVTAKTFALRDTLHLRDAHGQIAASVQAGWLGGYRVVSGERELATISGGSPPRVQVAEAGSFVVAGDIAGREYKIADRSRVLATVSRKIFSLAEQYGLDVPDPADALLAVAVAVALHRRQHD